MQRIKHISKGEVLCSMCCINENKQGNNIIIKEIPQYYTADQPTTPRGRDTEHQQ